MDKRFTTDNGSNEDVTLVDNLTGEEYESDFSEIVDLLNEFNEEYNELNCKLWDKYKECNKLLKENEQLKQSVQNIHKLIDKKIAEVKREYNKYSINSDQAEASIDALIDLKKELNVE